jgi:hypothetical protein
MNDTAQAEEMAPWGRTRADIRGRTATARSVVLLPLLLLLLSPLAEAKYYFYERQGQVLEIDLNPRLAQSERDKVLAWVQSTADALASVYGRWPRDRWRVRVKPVSGYGSDPVPWAQVNRGDPDVVSFYIDAAASKHHLVTNWTAYHEFSHLLIPYRGWGDMWFSEGLASYYQNLLQARHGVFDEREMWQRLHDGFVRGRSNRRPDLSLAELSPIMHENRSYMRVYWSGAWYFLSADLELRRRSHGRQSLDTALYALNACCADRKMSAREIARKLDAITGQALFVPLFDQVADSRSLPPFEDRYASLGIGIDGGRVSLDEEHASAHLRRSFAATQ